MPARGRSRGGHEREHKREHALKLELTHFVDDRIDVLEHLEGVVPHRYLFGAQRQVPPWAVRDALLRAEPG